MKIKFWLFAAIFAVAGIMSSCSDETTEPVIPPPPPIGPVTPSEEDMEFINEWMDKYMKTHYLWNTEYKTFKPDYKMECKAFLSSALNAVAQQNDANHEDGHWSNGKRTSFYSYISYYQNSTSGNTRLGENQAFGFGFTGALVGLIDGSYYFGILGVVPGSPADKAKITRAMFISRVNGITITKSNYNELYKDLFPQTGKTAKFSLVALARDENNVLEKENLDPVTITSTIYTDDPIITSQLILSREDPNLKVGYVAYNLFNAAFDEQLIGIFNSMIQNAEGKVTDLILDLRYNPGGYLKSSVVLATLVAGEKYKDELYCRTVYNADRNAKETPQEYRIGNKKISVLEGGTYDLVETALQYSLNLDRVYVLTSVNTASASELIINGLKGIGLDVRVVGDVTNGKNVGMEGMEYNYNGFTYAFYPITMRLENKVGFNDYSNGFTPDVLVANPDGDYMLGNYCTGADPLFSYAMIWIKEGKKPELSVAKVAATRNTVPFAIDAPRFAPRNLEGTIVKQVITE